jgi:hypothetical protein
MGQNTDCMTVSKSSYKVVCLVAKNAYKLHHVNMAACITTAATGRISLKLGIGDFYDNLLSNSKLG